MRRKTSKKWGVLLMAAVFITSSFLPAVTAAEPAAYTPDRVLKLWYDEPAPMGNEDMSKWDGSKNIADDGWEKWSLPLGNGYLGANVFGRTETERVQITENSLSNPYQSGQGGLNNFAEMYIDFNHSNPANYTRDLVLNDAVAHVQYDSDGVTYNREYFTSYPDKVMAIRLTASQDGKVSFTLRPTIPYLKEGHELNFNKSGAVTAAGDTITLSGLMEYYQIEFEGQFKVIPTGGTMTASNDANNDNGQITVENADSAIILVAVGTNYQLESRVFTEGDRTKKLEPYPHPHDKVTQMIADASAKSYDELLAAHKADYQNLFSRVRVDLGGSVAQVTTDELLNNYKNGTHNKYLEELYFQYGRYLLICSSRKGTLPPNLQGIWNRYDNSPWSAGYWHNINIQMNYWPVFNTNLPELFDCYIDYYKAYVPGLEQSASSHMRSKHPDNYDPNGQNGWSISTGAWPYQVSIPGGGGTDGYGTGALMAKSFYEYYNFTRNEELLQNELYPAVLGAANFMSRIMEPYGDLLLATPSASPENMEDGKLYQTIGSAWDQQNAYEINKDAIALANILGMQNDETVQYLASRYEKFDPVQVGYSGQIKEFREEKKYGEIGEYNHRHVSQLVGLFPGTLINATTPAWLDAAKVSLNYRGDQSTGWAMAHRLNLWARVKDGNRSYTLLQTLLKKGTLTNLWDTHPPFQIDGNLGGTAGIAEMLLQSHEGYINPLPARPDAWSSGSFDGLLARGNFEVSAKWANGQAQEFRILSKSGGRAAVKYYNVDKADVQTASGAPVNFTVDGTDLISFDTQVGETYVISGIPAFQPTTAPGSLTSETAEDYTNVSLAWGGAGGAASYRVYRALESSPDYELISADVTDTAYTYQIPEEDRGKQATYRVTAVGTNGRESVGVTSIELPVDVAPPTNVRGSVVGTTLQVSFTGVDKATGYNIYQKVGDAWQIAGSTKYCVASIENADMDAEYGISAVISTWESEIVPVGILNYENILLHKPITSDRGAIGGWPLENALDGDTGGKSRYAVSDKAGPYSVTINLQGSYALDKLRIYEFIPSEGGTRSPETTVELYDGGEWKTVIDKQPLIPPQKLGAGEYTEFDMGGQSGSQMKITFNNTNPGATTSASIFEITCSLAAIQPDASEQNLLLGKPIESTRNAMTQFPLSNALDGNTATRYAVSDTAGPYSVTIDIENEYILNKLKIYEFPPGESDTRSTETTVEVYNAASDAWTTVVDKQPLQPKPKSQTEFPLNNAQGSKLRITFNNTNPDAKTSASIFEIQCFASVGAPADKTALLLAVNRAGTVDTSTVEPDVLERFNTALDSAISALNSSYVLQAEVDTAEAALTEILDYIGADIPKPPVAKDLRVIGEGKESNELTLEYTFFDANSDTEGESQVQWQVSPNGTDEWKTIDGATGMSYTPDASMIGKYIRFSVRPVSVNEPCYGAVVYSDPVGPIALGTDLTTQKFNAISLEKTVSVYSTTGTAGGQIQILGTCEKGQYDITGDTRVQYTSSNTNVVTVNSNGALTIHATGFAIITATLVNTDQSAVSAKVLISVNNGSRTQQNFENYSYNPDVDTHVATVSEPVHTGSKSLKISKKPADSTSNLANWGGLDIYRSTPYSANMIAEGWFYDNGTNNSPSAYIYLQSHDKDESDNKIPLTGVYNIGLNTAKSLDYYWISSRADTRSEAQTGSAWMGAGAVDKVLDGTEGYPVMRRSKGWHQVTYISTGNSADRYTDKGTIEIYIDGELVFTENYVHPTMNVVRAMSCYDLPNASYYDDLALFQYIPTNPPSSHAVTVNVGPNGQVRQGDTVIENGGTVSVETGGSLSLTLLPDEGYEVETVLAGGQALTPSGDMVTVDNIAQDLTISVTFRLKGESEPSVNANGNVVSDPAYRPAGQVDPVYSALIYSTLNAGYGWEIVSVGVEIRDAAGAVIPLAVAQANITSDGRFGVRVFGAGLISGETYTLTPYAIVKKGAEQKKVYGQEKTFMVS